MAQKSITPKAKSKSKAQQLSMFRSSIFAFMAAFAGVTVAAPLTLAAVMPMVRSEVAAQTASLASRAVQMQPASSTLDICAVPAQPAAVGGGQVLGASTTAQTQPTVPGGGTITPTTPIFVKHLVNGVLTSNATISNTGPDSTNTVKVTNTATTTIKNDNNIKVNTQNFQEASTGDAKVKENTTAGAAITGDATNTNDNQFSISVNN